MKDDFSASESVMATKKTINGSSPFAQIASTEEQEAKRINLEIDAMKKESAEVEKALKEKELQTDQEMKDNAKKELVEYREIELAPLIQIAGKDASKEILKMEKAFKEKEDKIITKLTEEFINYSSSPKA